MEFRSPQGVPGFRINFNPGLGLLGEVEDAPRVGVHPGDDIVKGQPPLVGSGQQQGQNSLHAGEAGRRVFAILFTEQMRSVVGSEAIDEFKVIPEGLLVCGRGEAGADFFASRISAIMTEGIKIIYGK